MREDFEITAERLLRDLVTPDLLAAAGRGNWPERLWGAIEENGFCLAMTAEEQGGIGARWSDTLALVRAAGKFAAPIPLVEAIFANWLLSRCGIAPVSGPLSFASAEGALSNGRFSGVLSDVPWGGQADHVVTTANSRLLLLRTGDAHVTRAFNIAGEPRDMLRFEDAAPAIDAPLPDGIDDEALRLGGAMLRAGQISGALLRTLDIAVDYAGQRVQFGKAIGKFQVIQHRIALLAESVALTTAAVEAAFALASDILPTLPVASAKVVAGEAAGEGAAAAHAVLGAIGFTHEHALHFTTRRLWSWRSEFGSHGFWSRRIGALACAGGAGRYWPAITSGAFITEPKDNR